MDLWVVGAAAAAGYIAKYWQNVSRDRDSLSESRISKCENHEIPNCRRRKKVTEGTSTVERLSDIHQLEGVPEEVSTSGYVEKVGNLENYEQNIFSLLSLPLGVSTNEKLKENYVEQKLSGNMGDNTDGMDSFQDSTKKMSSLRTKHSYGRSIRPLSSLDSCVRAQLYKEHVKMEEYVFSAFPSPPATTRPLLVTDGNQTINRTNGSHFSAQIGTEDYRLCEKENVCGVPPLPKSSGLDIPSKLKSNTQKRNKGGLNNSHKTRSRRRFHSQNGSLDQTILFCLGVCLGVVSSLLTSRREVDKLKDLLKQSENLVQDMQEELEMKDSLTVKELVDVNCEPQDACDNSFHDDAPYQLLLVRDKDSSAMNLTNCGKVEESSEDMSRIEAELEAELERLGLNLNTSSMETRLSDLVEVDPNFVADFAQGELRTDMVDRRSTTGPESEQDASGTSTKSGNYAVSPRELSLRLHEVIQSRLEERVKKLEMALQDSERKVHVMESELKNGQMKLLSSKLRYSSGEGSPITEEDSMGQPLVMNLSGEALDAYNEAYDELMKIDESEEDDSPSEVYVNNRHGTLEFSQSILWDKKSIGNGSMIPHSENKEKPSGEAYLNQLKASIVHIPEIQQWHYDGASEDVCNDEMEQQLIKQIVEKTKKGSPAVMNAQRVLFLLDETDH